jgi:hypothetical protein
MKVCGVVRFIGFVTAVLMMTACPQRAPCLEEPPSDRQVRLDGRPYTLQFATLETSDPEQDVGLSGLTVDASGTLWSVTEETHRLIRLGPLGGSVVVGTSRPLTLTPVTLEAEGLAFVPDGRLVLVTEGPGARREDVVVVAPLAPSNGRVVGELAHRIPYASWQLVAPHNHGLEGASVVGDELVAVVEAVVEAPVRAAPVARLALADGALSAYRVVLTSKTGKLSAIDCRPAPQGPPGVLRCWAVERHYEVARIVSFDLPPVRPGPPQSVQARVLLDLTEVLDPCTNLEGLVWRGDALVLLSDNHGAKRRGPTWVLTLTPR